MAKTRRTAAIAALVAEGDDKAADFLRAVAEELAQEGITIVLTSHDLNAVAAHLPWVICFNRGVVAAGEPEKVLTPEILGRTYQAEIVVVETEAGRFMAHATPPATPTEEDR